MQIRSSGSRLVAALIAGVLVSCGGPGGDAPSGDMSPGDTSAEAPDPEALVGEWRLVLIEMDGADLPAPGDDAAPTLSFTAEADPTGSRRFGGSGGCNRIMGGYDAGRTGRLAISRGPAMTMMACPDAVMSLEQTFLTALESASAYSVEEGRLSIEFDGGVLRMERLEG